MCNIPVYGEEQRERGDGLLSAGEVGHGLEALAGRHAVVVDAVQVGLLGVLGPQERLSRLVHGQRLRADVRVLLFVYST